MRMGRGVTAEYLSGAPPDAVPYATTPCHGMRHEITSRESSLTVEE